MTKLKQLHSNSDLCVFAHKGCGIDSAHKLYVTSSAGIRGFRDPERAVCPSCSKGYTLDDEVPNKILKKLGVSKSELPILSN